MAKYVLENTREFERLEKQSQTDLFDYKEELKTLRIPVNAKILDAGCGSGIVSRYLAETYPSAQITGCDASEERIQQAKSNALQSVKNLTFTCTDLKKASFASNSFDLIVCRYVLEHFSSKDRELVLKELFRCLRPDGTLVVIDIDGYFFNLYPQTPLIQELCSRLDEADLIDLKIGRKLPSLLKTAGFEDIEWEQKLMNIYDGNRTVETQLIKERFTQTRPFLSSLLGSETKAQGFETQFLEALSQNETVLYYQKFIVFGSKPALRIAK